jgi:hypothetical protein
MQYVLGRRLTIKDEYLQNYLDEFCHKTNRRYLREQIVDRLMFR